MGLTTPFGITSGNNMSQLRPSNHNNYLTTPFLHCSYSLSIALLFLQMKAFTQQKLYTSRQFEQENIRTYHTIWYHKWQQNVPTSPLEPAQLSHHTSSALLLLSFHRPALIADESFYSTKALYLKTV
jgi:hypothetical protein